MNVLVLVSDAFGGRGGIAQYNRHLLRALCEFPGMERVIALPRVASYAPEAMPSNLEYKTAALGGKLRYAFWALVTAFTAPKIDLIVCSHISLLPIAYLLKLVLRCRIVPVIYGVEAWTPTTRSVVNALCRRLDAFITIRIVTAKRFRAWAEIDSAKSYYLPNCIDDTRYGKAPRRPDLEQRYGTKGKTVIMTAGRLDTSPLERNKGFDEMLEALPLLKERVPNLAYLIMGDGYDKARLEHRAEELNVRDLVVFTGYVPESEKADHYRLADVFAMPGSNPAFDRYPFRFVFLEALACGVPVVGCRLEDEEERKAPGTDLIVQIDPSSRAEIVDGIVTALARPSEKVGAGLETHLYPRFKARLHEIIVDLVGTRDGMA